MRKRTRSMFLRWLVLGFAMAVLVVPAAQARPIAPEGNGLAVAPSVDRSQVRAGNTKSGFDWSKAVVLGGVSISLSVTLGAALLMRNRTRLANG